MSRDEAIVVWFSYDPDGNQYWMIGNGEYVDGVPHGPARQIAIPVVPRTKSQEVPAHL